MKFKNNFRIILIMVFFIFLINSCTNKNLELKTASVTQELEQVSQIGTNIGDTPPDFAVITSEGKVVTLRDLIKQQKPIIIYFFATWCPWCAKDYAALSKDYKNYEDKVNFISIGLDLNEDLNIIREYKKEYPELQSTIFAQGQYEVLADYKVTKTTTKYVIDKNGKIIWAGSGAFSEQLWRTMFEEVTK